MIGTAVLVLHAVICWLLLSKMRVLAVPEVAQNLELLWLPAPPRQSPAPDETQNPTASAPSNRSAPSQPAPAPRQNPAPPENNAITPPIDWQADLDREAQASASAKAESRSRISVFRGVRRPRRRRRSSPGIEIIRIAWSLAPGHSSSISMTTARS
jgi:hypothetical protein